MSIFVPHKNVEENISYGQVINRVLKEYVQPELIRREIGDFSSVGIEISTNGKAKIFIDGEVVVFIQFKDRPISPKNVGANLKVNLDEIKDIGWDVPKSRSQPARIFLARFNKDWWIWDADYKKRQDLIERFKVTQTFTIRGGGYLPLKLRRQEKSNFMMGWQEGLHKELPEMWKRQLTMSQRYSGAMVYDGNYFDIFLHAQEMFVLGYFYTSVMLSRTAAEQALVQILIKSGKGLEIYKRGTRRLKSIEDLAGSCRSHALFGKRLRISKVSAKKLNAISNSASELVHPKGDLDELDVYKTQALTCMDSLYAVIKSHLNFVKDTGVVSGYRLSGTSKRLK